MSNPWRQEMNGEEDIGRTPAGPEPDGGNADRQRDTRFDPVTLFSEIKADDWRSLDNPPTTVIPNALGVNHRAVLMGGVIKFFEPVPSDGHSNFAGDQGGAKAPFPVRFVKTSIEIDCPPTTGFAPLTVQEAAPFFVPSLFPPVGAVWADIINRGRFSEKLGEIPLLTDIPVSQMGGGGGTAYDLGACLAGTGHNMIPDRRNGYPRPDDLVLTPETGNGLKAEIKLNTGDILSLGAKIGRDEEGEGVGYGSPLTPGLVPYFIPGSGGEVPKPDEWKVKAVPMPFRCVKLCYFGQRGINIRVGKGSISTSAALSR